MRGVLVLGALAVASCNLVAGLDGYQKVPGAGAGGSAGGGGAGGERAGAFQYGDAPDEANVEVELYDAHSAALVGLFDGSLVFAGAEPLSASFPKSLFIAEVRDDGTSTWARQIDGTFEAPRLARLSDGQGMAVAATTVAAPNDTVAFGPFPLYLAPAQPGAVVGVFDGGTASWAQLVGTGPSWKVVDVAGESARVVVGGTFHGILAPTSAVETMSASEGASEGFVVSFASGTATWAQRIYDTGAPYDAQDVGGLGVDAMGNVHVAGVCSGMVQFGANVGAGCGNMAVFVVTYSAVGDPIGEAHEIAIESADGTPKIEVTAMAVAPDGKVALAGAFDGNLHIDAPLTSDGRALFVALLDTDRSPLWRVGSSPVGPGTIIRTLAFAPNGDVLALGAIDTALTLGDGMELALHGDEDVLLARFQRANGQVMTVSTYGGAGSASVASGLSSLEKTVVIAGHFTGNLEIGGTTLQADTSAPDVFVAWFGE
jgi:hypothetical protein